MSDDVTEERVDGGMLYTNVSGAPQLVTVTDGDAPDELGRLRTARSIVDPGKSWTIDVSHKARMTSSRDISSAQGRLYVDGGCN